MKEKNNTPLGDENESIAAKRLKALGDDTTPQSEDEEPVKINKLANFWYHNKAKIIVISVFSIILSIGVVQLASRNNPDVNLIYGGPEYITPNENRDFCKLLESIMPDYNEDGKVYAQLNDLVFMSEAQVEELLAKAEENGEKAAVDLLSNKQMSERFTYEIFGGESVICILSEDQYNSVKGEGGFLPLSEIFDELPEGVIDEYGVRFCDTKLYKFYDSAKIFPDDAVIALRRLSTLSVFTGKKKAEINYEYHRDLFKRILEFEYPEGYTPDAE